MKTLEYYYIEHYLKFATPFEKRLGWGVWHSCFDYLDVCGVSLRLRIDVE